MLTLSAIDVVRLTLGLLAVGVMSGIPLGVLVAKLSPDPQVDQQDAAAMVDALEAAAADLATQALDLRAAHAGLDATTAQLPVVRARG